jgi:hypothetical protein
MGVGGFISRNIKENKDRCPSREAPDAGHGGIDVYSLACGHGGIDVYSLAWMKMSGFAALRRDKFCVS